MNFNGFEIYTDRLILRPVGLGDAADLFVIYADVETMKYWSEPPMVAVTQAEQKISQTLSAQAEGVALGMAVVLKANTTVIGQISLFNIHEGSGRAEIGYMLNKAHWHKGYMGEAMTAFITGCFNQLNLRRLEADIDPANIASAALLGRLGFVKEGLFKCRWVVDGQISDSEMYGLLKSGFLG